MANTFKVEVSPVSPGTFTGEGSVVDSNEGFRRVGIFESDTEAMNNFEALRTLIDEMNAGTDVSSVRTAINAL